MDGAGLFMSTSAERRSGIPAGLGTELLLLRARAPVYTARRAPLPCSYVVAGGLTVCTAFMKGQRRCGLPYRLPQSSLGSGRS